MARPIRPAEGSQNGRAALTPGDVREARRLRRLGWTYRQIGIRFLVANSTAWAACTGKTWREV